jgi:hypothetical protein
MAIALEARRSIETCRVPSGQHGVSKVVGFGVVDYYGRAVRRKDVVFEPGQYAL